MRVNFGEIINEVLGRMGKTQDAAETPLLDSIKLRINQIQSKLYFASPWEWRNIRSYFSTKAPLSAGTVSVTKGSRAVTGSGTAFTDIVKFGHLVIGDTVIKVDPHTAVTSTSLSLVAPYAGDTNSAATYQVVISEYPLDAELAAITDVYVNDKDIRVVNKDRTVLRFNSTGEPEEATITDRSTFDFYTTGTVAVTNGSKTAIGTGTTFTEDMIGMPFKTDENAELYTVQSVSSATVLALRQSYNGDTGSGKTYKICPVGSPVIQFSTAPNNVHFVQVDGLTYPRKLVSDTDESAIPNHAPLLHGAIWLALRDLDNKPVSQIQEAKKTYEESVKELKDTYKVVKGVKWTSENEIYARKTLRGRVDDPLNTRTRL